MFFYHSANRGGIIKGGPLVLETEQRHSAGKCVMSSEPINNEGHRGDRGQSIAFKTSQQFVTRLINRLMRAWKRTAK